MENDEQLPEAKHGYSMEQSRLEPWVIRELFRMQVT